MLIVLSCSVAAGQEEPASRSDSDLIVERIVVTATRSPLALTQVPAAMSVVGNLDIQGARQTVSLDESLTRVPGVFIQNSSNFAQDLRVQIRGFGTRAAFGVREVRVLLDGLPETLPDGQTQLDGVDLGAIERIEVLRRPAGSLYGNASGGVIHLITEKGPDFPWADVRSTGGSFGLAKVQMKGGGKAGNAKLFLNTSHLRIDGYRDHSGSRTTTVNMRLGYEVTRTTHATLLLDAVDSPLADDPGALTREEVDADRRQARDLNLNLDAGEEVQQGRIGTVVNYRGGQGEFSAYGYLLYRDFENRLPVPPASGAGIVTFDRFSPGAGARYAAHTALLGVDQTLSVGIDVQHQDDDRRRFENVDGERGAQLLDQRERVTSVGPYFGVTASVREDTEISASVRYDAVHYDVDVHADASGSNDSGSRTMDAWSPAGGLLYSPWAGLSLFANVGTTFQVPTTTELGNPDGSGLNEELEPQTAVTYEAGARIERGKMSGGLAAFFTRVEDELIRFESPSGRDAFRNAGRSRRFGLEADWQLDLSRGLRWSGAVTWLDAEFRDYETDAGNFRGNEEPGIPSWQFFQELLYSHPIGAYAAVEAFLVDGYFVDDGNTARSPGYELVNLRAGYEGTFGAFTIEPFVGLNNVSDAKYDGTVRLNAHGGRYFEPAPGFNVFGGISVSARL